MDILYILIHIFVPWVFFFANDLIFTFYFICILDDGTKKEMATHSSILAWRIPGTEEPGGLLSMGLHRVGHD